MGVLFTPRARDASSELELLHEARLEDGLEAGRLAPEFRERGLARASVRGTCRR